MSTEHIIIAASSNISINSLTATKSSDTVLFTNVNEVSFKVRPNSFQVPVLRDSLRRDSTRFAPTIVSSTNYALTGSDSL